MTRENGREGPPSTAAGDRAHRAGLLAVAGLVASHGWPALSGPVDGLLAEVRAGHWPCPRCSSWRSLIEHVAPAREVADGRALRCSACGSCPTAEVLAGELRRSLDGIRTLAEIVELLAKEVAA